MSSPDNTIIKVLKMSLLESDSCINMWISLHGSLVSNIHSFEENLITIVNDKLPP